MAYKLAGKTYRSIDLLVVCNLGDGSVIDKLTNIPGGHEWQITGLSNDNPVLVYAVFSTGHIEGYGNVIPVSE